jgi:aminopeptidase N
MFDLQDGRLQRRRTIELDIDSAVAPIRQIVGERVPDLVLVNDEDLTYCKVRFDERSLQTLKRHLRDIDDSLARAIAWGALWDMARDAQLRAGEYVAIALANMEPETDASTLKSLLSRTEHAVDSLSDPGNRPTIRALLARESRECLSRSQPGADMQILWAGTFIGAARARPDVEWVRGLLDGTTQPEGLVTDRSIRWGAVTALATIGAVDEDLVASELKRDPTDEGQRHAAAARAAQPLPPAKHHAWNAVMHDEGAPSFLMKRAIAGGFHRPDQEELLSQFVAPYFEGLVPYWETHDSEEAIAVIEMMFPHAVIAQEVDDATDSALERDLPGPIRRSLLESQDAIRRALRAQAFDRTEPGV